jgi:hypothetical protein
MCMSALMSKRYSGICGGTRAGRALLDHLLPSCKDFLDPL